MAATYILGPFCLDAETDTLFRGGEPVSLGHRAVALLRVLETSDLVERLKALDVSSTTPTSVNIKNPYI